MGIVLFVASAYSSRVCAVSMYVGVRKHINMAASGRPAMLFAPDSFVSIHTGKPRDFRFSYTDVTQSFRSLVKDSTMLFLK